MTISMFDAYLERAYAVRSVRMMDLSQATAYAQANDIGRNRLWNSWNNTVTKSTTKFMQDLYHNTRQSIITWNGVPMDHTQLVEQFRRMWGRKAVADK